MYTLYIFMNTCIKIYKFFHIYTVRVTELKQFCDFIDIEYQRILQHENTRFLSLLPALQRILEKFEGLISYFNSQEGCPTLIKNCFEDPTQELYVFKICSWAVEILQSDYFKARKRKHQCCRSGACSVRTKAGRTCKERKQLFAIPNNGAPEKARRGR